MKSWIISILVAASVCIIAYGFVSATARASGYAVRTCAPAALIYPAPIVQPICQVCEPIYTIQQPVVSYRQNFVQSYAQPIRFRQHFVQQRFVQPVILRQRQSLFGGGGGSLLNINFNNRQRFRSGGRGGLLNLRLR